MRQVTGEELVDEALLDFVVDSQKYDGWGLSYHQALVGVCVDQVFLHSSAVGLIDQSVLLRHILYLNINFSIHFIPFRGNCEVKHTTGQHDCKNNRKCQVHKIYAFEPIFLLDLG